MDTFETVMDSRKVVRTHWLCPWCVQEHDSLVEIATHIDFYHRGEMTADEISTLDKYLAKYDGVTSS